MSTIEDAPPGVGVATPETDDVQDSRDAYRGVESGDFQFRSEDDGSEVLEGRMMPYEKWTEIDSRIEGHFMERFAAGSLAKSIKEQASKIRVLVEHGQSRAIGNQPIAQISELWDQPDGAYFRAKLLQGLPELLRDGLRKGLYGSSIRFRPIRAERVRFPKESTYNPARLSEHTYKEARIREFSVVTFPAYEGATARIRSITDDVLVAQMFAHRNDMDDLLANHSALSPVPAEATQDQERREPGHGLFLFVEPPSHLKEQ